MGGGRRHGRFMTQQRVTLGLVSITLLTAGLVPAQPTDFPGFRRPDPLWSVSVGGRYHSGGAGVEFGNLGVIPVTAAALDQNRNYVNGLVTLDALRQAERNAAGNQTSTPGGRYQTTTTDADNNVSVTGDFVSFTPGFARDWAYSDASQVGADGRIAFDRYGAVSRGGTVAATESDSSVGFDLDMTRRLGKLGTRWEWGITGGLGLSEVRAESTGTVVSDLRRLRDFYVVRDGVAPDAPYDAPTFIDLANPDGTVLVANGFETTRPLSQDPVAREDGIVPGGTTINGRWKVDGAYFLVRLGPSLRGRLTERLGVSFSAGLAAGYVGTTFSAEESFQPPGATQPANYTAEDDGNDLLVGFYGSANVEFWITPATGLYVGASFESLDTYDQSLEGRRVKIDIGEGVAVRAGIVYRF